MSQSIRKPIVSVVLVGLISSPLSAAALTTEERLQLLQLITTLTAQVASLQTQLNAMIATTGVGAQAPTERRFSTPLTIGSEGPVVTFLQQILATDSLVYPQARVTGYYGEMTAEAVRRLQTMYGIPADGRFDGLVRDRVEAALRAQPFDGRSSVFLRLPRVAEAMRGGLVTGSILNPNQSLIQVRVDTNYGERVTRVTAVYRDRPQVFQTFALALPRDTLDQLIANWLQISRADLDSLAFRTSPDAKEVESFVVHVSWDNWPKKTVTNYRDTTREELEITVEMINQLAQDVYDGNRENINTEMIRARQGIRAERLIRALAQVFRVSEEEVERLLRFSFEGNQSTNTGY